MILAEYQRFLQSLTDENISSDVRKITNLVLNNLDTMIPLTTSKGKRVQKMVEFLQDNWDSLSDMIEFLSVSPQFSSSLDTRLQSLSVESFRGFTKQEEFDLDSRLVLIYRQNGTGKSSFCESLEYGLLGNVAEPRTSD